MKRVFVFCIGGTGLRVMKAATMLMAGGLDTNGYTVVPVILDPHLDLEEKRKLSTLVQDYIAIHRDTVNVGGTVKKSLSGFFSPAMEEFSDVTGRRQDAAGITAGREAFGAFIQYNNLQADAPNRYLADTLFSEANLNNGLSVGFKGNPNVGTVVLGRVIEGDGWLQAFCNAFQQGDRVFIISSIFGGTGASGYPMLEKTLRTTKHNPNVAQAMMGAVTVLPYYALTDGTKNQSDIDSANFITKAKAALAYYEKSVKSHFLYYAGEQSMLATYENDEQTQADKAHFVELLAASALFDFLQKKDPPTETQYMTRSLRENEDPLTLSSLGDAYRPEVKAVADLMLLKRLVYFLPDERWFPLAKRRGFDKTFYDSRSFKRLEEFLDKFDSWYGELKQNKRSFAPLNVIPLKNREANLQEWLLGESIDAKDESYILLEMIKAGVADRDRANRGTLRGFLHFAFKGINHYTS